ncbi:hypothetical protein DFP73DRAFT_590474 [Morchella snyderi]|nr:hypothetical protein DFP73DRAFT_590474 [Morchella snyderi]
MNFFTFLTALFVLVHTAVALAVPTSAVTDATIADFNSTLEAYGTLEKRQFNAFIVCETSSGSPYTTDVRRAANTLLNKASICKQNNLTGSKCTQMTDHNSAAIGICGPPGSQVHCMTAGRVGRAIAERCNNRGLAGGYGQYEWGRIAVYVP